jgi:hypothetical protein
MPRPTPRAGPLRIEAETLDVRKGEEAPPLVAYAFGRSGRLLARTELKQGTGEVQLPELKEPETVRVLIGPPIDQEDGGEVLAALMRLDVPQASIRSDQIAEPVRLAVDRAVWNCWFRFCVARGVLLKRVQTGDLHVDLPVCDAEIEIYEVDPVSLILPKIPDYVIERIRDRVRIPWPWPPPQIEQRFPGGIPFPPLPPGPGPDPLPFLGGLMRRAARVPRQFAKSASTPDLRSELASLMREGSGGEETIRADAEESHDEEPTQERLFAFTSGEATEVDPDQALGSLQALAQVPQIRLAANTSTAAFKAELLANPMLLRPLLCWLWPQAVTMNLVATATTNGCGKFRASFYRGCSSDTPDLYFKAFRRIGFFRIPIYAPLPVACHTWWNYACGSELTLYTSSPFAQTCPPCAPVIAPNHWVLAMAVGNISLAGVRGTSMALQPTTDASNLGLTSGGSPWGGYIRLRFEFDHTLRTDLNVRYYRVRWRKAGSGNPFVAVTEDVWRHYAHMVGPTLMIEPYKLGPQSVGTTANLYEMPPGMPPAGQWIIADAVVDTTSAAFRSTSFAPANGGEGHYEFELTLYDAAGTAVNANAAGISYRVPDTLDLTTTIPTSSANLLGLVTPAGRLVYRLHVDNNSCDAAVQPPQIGGSASGDICGLLRYEPGDAVTLQWTATHPSGFATFSHNVVKGATPVPPPVSSSGSVGPAPGTHVETHSVETLLGDCTIAGFAETVSVWATATDGWSRRAEYDRHVIQAFALAPAE